MRLWVRFAPKVSAEVLIFLPEFGPRKTRRTADENVGMVFAFFVVEMSRIWHMHAGPAGCECCVDLIRVEPRNDERGRRRHRIATQPGGVGGTDRRGQAVLASKHLHGALFTIVCRDNAKAFSLRWRKSIAHLRDGLHEGIPALFFAQILVLR